MHKKTFSILTILMLIMTAFAVTAYAATSDSYDVHVWNYTTSGEALADITTSGTLYSATSSSQDAYMTGEMSGEYDGGWIGEVPISVRYNGLNGMTVAWYEARCVEGTDYDCAYIGGGIGNSYVTFTSPNPSTAYYVGFDAPSSLSTYNVEVYQQLMSAYEECQSSNCNVDDQETASVTKY